LLFGRERLCSPRGLVLNQRSLLRLGRKSLLRERVSGGEQLSPGQ